MPILHASNLAGGIAALDAFEQYAESRTHPGFGLMFYRCQVYMGDARKKDGDDKLWERPAA